MALDARSALHLETEKARRQPVAQLIRSSATRRLFKRERLRIPFTQRKLIDADREAPLSKRGSAVPGFVSTSHRSRTSSAR
jgi:hypothetical protein